MTPRHRDTERRGRVPHCGLRQTRSWRLYRGGSWQDPPGVQDQTGAHPRALRYRTGCCVRQLPSCMEVAARASDVKRIKIGKKSAMLGIPTASQAMPAPLRLSLLPALPLQDQSCQCPRALRRSMGSRFSVGGTRLVKHRHASDVRRSTPGVLAPVQVTFQARRTGAVVLAREILFGLPMVAWDYLIKGRLHVRPALLSSIARAYRKDRPRGTLDQDASIPLPGSRERESC
jgi:hypothetical protein